MTPLQALVELQKWVCDLSEQEDSNALDYLRLLRRGHCRQYEDAQEVLHASSQDLSTER